MLVEFLLHLRRNRLPVSTTEFLMLLDALARDVCDGSLQHFYYLSRGCLVKNEAFFDRFDVAFGEFFEGVERLPDMAEDVPEAWIKVMARHSLMPEELAMVDIDVVLGRARARLAGERRRQRRTARAEVTPELRTVRSGPRGAQAKASGEENGDLRNISRRWVMRDFQGLDDRVELGTRNMKVALRRLRRFAREGVPVELDIDRTIDATARNAGLLELRTRPDRYNAMKVVLCFDVSASMGRHVRACEQLFASARHEFKHLEYFYFYNCVYQVLFKGANQFPNSVPTADILHKYGPEHKLILVGDATMNPHEITYGIDGEESGEVWLRRMTDHFRSVCWLNPSSESRWDTEPSVNLIRRLVGGRMFSLNLEGISAAMRELGRRH